MTTSTCSADVTALPSAFPALARAMPRRGFLAGLTRLPLLGGSVALIGQPRAVAEPATPDMLEAYKTWLEYERRWLSWEMAADPLWQRRYGGSGAAEDRVKLSDRIDGCLAFIGESNTYHRDHAAPSTRAALVMSTVGCDWHDSDARAARRRA